MPRSRYKENRPQPHSVANEENTARLVDINLQLLLDTLSKHGVSSDEINCQHGSPPVPPRQQRHTLLVDTRA